MGKEELHSKHSTATSMCAGLAYPKADIPVWLLLTINIFSIDLPHNLLYHYVY